MSWLKNSHLHNIMVLWWRLCKIPPPEKTPITQVLTLMKTNGFTIFSYNDKGSRSGHIYLTQKIFASQLSIVFQCQDMAWTGIMHFLNSDLELKHLNLVQMPGISSDLTNWWMEKKESNVKTRNKLLTY